MESRSRSAFVWAILSSSLAAAALNLAASALAHPRALASFEGLVLPLAVGWGALFVVALVVFGLFGVFARGLGLAPEPVRAALCVGFALAGALAPLVEVGLRAASTERASVVIVCASGFVVCAALFAHARAVRRGEYGVETQPLLVFLPVAALAVLAALWFVEYRAEGNNARAGGALAGLVVIAGGAWMARRVAPGPTLSALTAFVVMLGGMAARRDTQHFTPARPAASDRPPVVLLTVDTLRADRVLGDGPRRVPTPGIDSLAADSVVFTQARAAAPWTKPSLATLLTGVAPLVHGMTNRRARLPQEIDTLAERLRAAGYHTAGVGLNAHLERAFGFDQGFDDYAFPARPDYGLALGARVLERFAPARFPEVYPSTTAIAEVAQGWIRAHAREPFFLWMHVLDPHWPYEPPPEFVEHPEREPRRWGEPEMVTDVQAGNTKPGQAERERVEELYAGEIRYVDSEIAHVLATLRELGLYDKALIVFASDHGEEFWEHGRYEHGHTLYDEVLRVPLCFKLPGAEAKSRVDAAISTQALTPTVLDVLGLAYDPELMSSRSLAPWWRVPETVMPAPAAPETTPETALPETAMLDAATLPTAMLQTSPPALGDAAPAAPRPARPVPEPLFMSGTYYFGEKRGVVFDGRKLVLELDTGRRELYDLADDPHELRSLAAAQPDTTEAGLALLREWEARCAALRVKLGITADSSVEAGGEVERAMQGLGYGGRE